MNNDATINELVVVVVVATKVEFSGVPVPTKRWASGRAGLFILIRRRTPHTARLVRRDNDTLS